MVLHLLNNIGSRIIMNGRCQGAIKLTFGPQDEDLLVVPVLGLLLQLNVEIKQGLSKQKANFMICHANQLNQSSHLQHAEISGVRTSCPSNSWVRLRTVARNAFCLSHTPSRTTAQV